jgi:hypothetical protein
VLAIMVGGVNVRYGLAIVEDIPTLLEFRTSSARGAGAPSLSGPH